ncbi:MAG: phosphoenolpyruvate--protein phosphotransferase [Acidobacteriota bacterium]
MKFQGIAVSPGIAIGKALVVETTETTIFRIPISEKEVAHEKERFKNAIAQSKKQLQSVKEKISKEVSQKYSFIFDAHLLILEDESLIGEVLSIIGKERVNAEWALKIVVGKLLKAFENISDPYFRERGGDIEDIYRRVQAILAGGKNHHRLSELIDDVIVVAHSLSPADTALLNTDHVIAFATDLGGRTSHTAILANALEIPAVVGLLDVYSRVRNRDEIVVDGNNGLFIINPTEKEKEEYLRKKIRYERKESRLLELRGVPAITRDGTEIKLMANIELPGEIHSAIQHGAHGIGLYRSEFLYLMKSPDLPTEEDHFRLYREIAEKVYPDEALVRTLDLGGEKYFHAVLEKDEANPVMGLRAIRLCLKRKDIFRLQLRGILKASHYGNIKIMFPLISTIEELRNARSLLEEIKEELRREGTPFNERMEIGIMIEVPAAAMIADILAREVQFISIGTNDLIQYYMAADRSNKSVSYLYQPLHPSILRTLKFVIDGAAKNNVDVSICGEMASDPFCLPVLLGLGMRKLSMNPKAIPTIKKLVMKISIREMAGIMEEAQKLGSAEEIERFLIQKKIATFRI